MELYINVNLIKNYIKSNKLTHEQFYKYCGVSRSIFYRILREKCNVKFYTIAKVAKGMNIRTNQLILSKSRFY